MMKAKTESIEYEKHTQKILAKTRKGLPRVRSNIDQSDCPHWALDMLEELKQDTKNVTRNNVYLRLAMALNADDLLRDKYPHLINFALESVMHEITFKRPKNKASKQDQEARRRLKILFQVLHQELKGLLAENTEDGKFTYTFRYIAKEQGIQDYTPITKEGEGGLYGRIGKAWWGDGIDHDKVKQYLDGIKANKNAKRIFHDFMPVKIPT